MKVIIAGCRDLKLSFGKMVEIIAASGFEVTEVVSGHYRGVDESGEEYANQLGLPLALFPAEWEKYLGRAGPIRNSKMAVYAEALIAVPTGGNGTNDMIAKMKALGKPVFICREPNE